VCVREREGAVTKALEEINDQVSDAAAQLEGHPVERPPPTHLFERVCERERV